MKLDKRFALRCGLTLMAIAGISASIIGVLSMVTSPIIENNAIKKEKEALDKVFKGESKSIGSKVEVNKDGVIAYYPVTLNDDSLARIYKANGKNGFGEVSFLLGLYDGIKVSLGSLIMLSNTESYASTLKENYIDVYQKQTNPEDREEALNKVTCGATSGAKLIRGLVENCRSHYEGDKS